MMLNLLNRCGNPEIIGPYLAALSYKSQSGTAIILTFLGTAKVSTKKTDKVHDVCVLKFYDWEAI